MANKTAVTVTTAYGTFTRTTGRTYTHIVIGRGNSAAYLSRQRAEDIAKLEVDRERWGVYGWSGRLDLARSVARQWKDIPLEMKIIEIASGHEVASWRH